MTDAADAVLRYQVQLEGLSVSTANDIAADIDQALASVQERIEEAEEDSFTFDRFQRIRRELLGLRLALLDKVTGRLDEALNGVVATSGPAATAAVASLGIEVSDVAIPIQNLLPIKDRTFGRQIVAAVGRGPCR